MRCTSWARRCSTWSSTSLERRRTRGKHISGTSRDRPRALLRGHVSIEILWYDNRFAAHDALYKSQFSKPTHTEGLSQGAWGIYHFCAMTTSTPIRRREQRFLRVLHREACSDLPAHYVHPPAPPRPLPDHLPLRARFGRAGLQDIRRSRARVHLPGGRSPRDGMGGCRKG